MEGHGELNLRPSSSSRGSTLSLAYSQTHPDRCTALILRGIFLLRRSELLFFYQNGASRKSALPPLRSPDIWPEEWDEYASVIPPAERGDLMTAYYKRLTSDDDEISLKAAQAWSKWEDSTCHLMQSAEAIAQINDHRRAR